MADIETYVQKGTGQTVFRVRWTVYVDGKRTRPGESFTGPDPKEARLRADRFKLDVELAGNNWPPNYVPKVGYVAPERMAALEEIADARQAAAADARTSTPFIAFAGDYIDGLADVTERTRADYHRTVSNHFATFPAFADADLADTETLTGDDVKAWTKWMTEGVRTADKKGWERVPRSGKTTANARGLLYSIIQSAIVREHPLRKWNPCLAAGVPRLDRGRIDDEDMCVLTGPEFEILYWACHESVRPMLLADVGSGMRFSEITAQWTKDYRPERHHTRVQRAWKRIPGKGTVLGEPKSEAGRRIIPLDDITEAAFDRCSRGRALTDLTFTTRTGAQMRHSNFWNRYWVPGLYRSVRCEEHRAQDREKGILVNRELVRLTNMKDVRIRHLIPCGCEGTSRKVLTFHGLRHTYASWQIDGGIRWHELAASMGHESSRTTEETYVHLLPDAERKQAAAHTAALSPLRLMPSLGL